MSTRQKRSLKISRDGVLFAAGLLGVLHETLLGTQDRPTLLLLFAGMMGLPAFLRADEARKGGGT
jgi:hypothetical protein